MKGGAMCTLHKIAFILLFVGGVNWGLVGLFDLDLVQSIFGGAPLVADIVYVLVGLSALFMLLKKKCKACHVSGGGKMAAPPAAPGTPQGN